MGEKEKVARPEQEKPKSKPLVCTSCGAILGIIAFDGTLRRRGDTIIRATVIRCECGATRQFVRQRRR